MFGSGAFGCILALIVLRRSRNEQKKTIFYRLVGALAITDMLGTCFTSPVTLIIYMNQFKWVGGQELCDYFSFIFIFTGNSTVFIVGVMALERYLAIQHPYLYNAHASTKKAHFILIGLWLLAFVIATAPLLGLGSNVLQYPGTWCFFNSFGVTVTDKIFSYFYASVGLLVILVIIICNIIVISTLVKMRRRNVTRRLSTLSFTGKVKKQSSEIQMMVHLVGIICVFVICWAPLMVSRGVTRTTLL